MEASTIKGTYMAESQSGFPSDLCDVRLTARVEGDKVKMSQDDGDSFILITNVLYIISSPSELLITNPQGTLRFTKCVDSSTNRKLS